MGVFEPLLSPRVIQCLLCVSLVVDDYMCPLKRGPFHKLLRELDRSQECFRLVLTVVGGAGQGRRPGKVVWSCPPAEDLVLKCEG